MAHSLSRSAPRENSNMKHADSAMEQRKSDMAYFRFFGMIATSTVVMFLLTFTNVYSIDHVHWSEQRFYMALLMGSAMAVIMLGFMWQMHSDRRMNFAILGAALLIGASSLWLSRSQRFVEDESYMRGMIPHHSIAILTSDRAQIDDVRVHQLSQQIIESQEREILEMEWLLEDIRKNGEARTDEEAASRPVPDFGE